ncbi:hypothetical protein ACQPZF_36400 [Actinosynnema sp. CS-041913]|uniref:hypothetical protein n=1 Tax=Actinosynnema sp. CS-041913 TaxID=3239917 RepID=UPI003D92FD6E
MAIAAVFASGVVVGRQAPTDRPVEGPDLACERGDEALAAAAAAQLAVLVPQRVAGRQAARDAARALGAALEVAERFGQWAEQENPVYRHALFGATAVKVGERDGDRAQVTVDGYWLRSADAANGAGEFANALWTYWLVWRDGRWVPSSPPEATTLPGDHTGKAAAFIRIKDGFAGVPHVRC